MESATWKTGLASWWMWSLKSQPSQRSGGRRIINNLQQVRRRWRSFLKTAWLRYLNWPFSCGCCAQLLSHVYMSTCLHVYMSTDPTDCSPPGSSVHGISQARMLEWVATPSSRGSSRPRDCVSCVLCIGRHVLYYQATWEAQTFLFGVQLLPNHIILKNKTKLTRSYCRAHATIFTIHYG